MIKNPTILLADDDDGILAALILLLKSEGFAVVSVRSTVEVIETIKTCDIHAVLMDLNYSLDTTSGAEGVELIGQIRQLDEHLPIVVMTGWGTVELAVRTILQGANDFIQKPWDNDRLLATLNNQLKLARAQKQNTRLRQQVQLQRAEQQRKHPIIATSPPMRKLLATLRQVAASDVNVLLTGENGTGKSLFARYLHEHSQRCDGPFIAVNMGAITDSLFESEMFGHLKGAFTDAVATRIGRFELADEGSLFLDEIANTPESQQAKLLRVLEESQFEKVGSSKTQRVNVRLITATNADISQAIKTGQFRKDLFYRINTVELTIPPLRHRQDDILPMAEAFLGVCANKYNKPPLRLGNSAKLALLQYPWPGNVRELNHVLERAQILCDKPVLEAGDLTLTAEIQLPQVSEGTVDLRTLESLEQAIIEQRFTHFNGDAQQAAHSLGLSRSAFYRRLSKRKNNAREC